MYIHRRTYKTNKPYVYRGRQADRQTYLGVFEGEHGDVVGVNVGHRGGLHHYVAILHQFPTLLRPVLLTLDLNREKLPSCQAKG